MGFPPIEHHSKHVNHAIAPLPSEHTYIGLSTNTKVYVQYSLERHVLQACGIIRVSNPIKRLGGIKEALQCRSIETFEPIDNFFQYIKLYT